MSKLGRPPGSYTQYRRLAQLREMLENHPKGVSLAEIGRKLHVTERSVRRYLRELQRDVDLERTPEPDGFGGMVVKIPTRDLPRRVKLHRTQIYGLLMARRVFRILEGTMFEKVLRDAVDQLLSHVQRSPRRGAQIDPDTRLEDRFLYLPSIPMRPVEGDAAECLDTLLDACAQLRVCTIVYRKGAVPSRGDDATETLTVHPYAVVLYKDTVYCVCWVKQRNAIRTLRADRMIDVDADPLNQFPLPDGFSVDAHFAGQFGVHTGESAIRVVIDFHARVAEYVRTRRFPGEGGKDATYDELPGGGVRLNMVVGATTEVRSWVLSFGETARVIEPQVLADDVVAELRGALEAYEAKPPSLKPPAKEKRAKAPAKRAAKSKEPRTRR